MACGEDAVFHWHKGRSMKTSRIQCSIYGYLHMYMKAFIKKIYMVVD